MKGEVSITVFSKNFFFFKQALRGISAHKSMSFLSVCIVTASLILLGLFTAESMNINYAVNSLANSKEINIYLSKDAAGRSIEDIESELKTIDGIEAVTFHSREDRLQTVIDEVYKDKEHIFAGEDNPLRDSYIITIGNSQKLNEICDKLSSVKGVEEVIKSSDVIIGIDALVSGIKNIYIWITLLFVLIAIFIISGTIRLGIVARSDEIEIMKTVGATNGFIITPFIFEAFIMGLIGAVLSSLIVLCGYGILTGRASYSVSSDILNFVSTGELAATFIPVALFTGIIIGIIGCIPSVKKYLK